MIATSVLVLSLLVPQAALPGDRELGSTTEPDGTTRTYRVSYVALAKAPAWDPEHGPPPLPMARAIQLAREWLLKRNPKVDGFRPSHFMLERVSEGGGRQEWVWQIHFEPRLGEHWLSSSGFEVYLLMDGTAVAPTVSKGTPYRR